METERRVYAGEIRLTDNGEDGPKIAGYAAVFNQKSDDLGGFIEIIEPGAFTDTLAAGADVRALFNHDPNLILGRTVSETLTLSEDDLGLRYEIMPPNTQYATDLIASLKRGDIDQSSFGFLVTNDVWETQDEQPIRRVHAVQLFDVSPVTFPAYPTTSAEARDMALKIAAGGGATGADQTDQDAAGRLVMMRNRLKLLEQIGDDHDFR